MLSNLFLHSTDTQAMCTDKKTFYSRHTHTETQLTYRIRYKYHMESKSKHQLKIIYAYLIFFSLFNPKNTQD